MNDFDYFNYLRTRFEQSNKITSITKVLICSTIVIMIMKILKII